MFDCFRVVLLDGEEVRGSEGYTHAFSGPTTIPFELAYGKVEIVITPHIWLGVAFGKGFFA